MIEKENNRLEKKCDASKILICGFMGAGKSTFLHHLESAPFEKIELDKCYGDSPSKMINEKGMNYFRSIEAKTLTDLLNNEQKLLISLGGGSLNEQNLPQILDNPRVRIIYLDVPFETCFERIKGDPSRPLALLDEMSLKNLYKERLKVYQNAHIRIDYKQIKEIQNLKDLLLKEEVSN